MKKKIIFCLLSLPLMIAGCQSNEIEDITPPSKEVQLSPEELLSIRYKSSPELSQTEVFNLLTTFQSSELKNNAHSRITFQPNIFQIKEKYYLSKNKADARNIESTEEQIPIYKIEFTSETGTGMAVVSGDRRAPHILAYIDNIKENQDSLYTSPNALLQWSEMYIRNEVTKFDEIKDSLYESAVLKISKELYITSKDIDYEAIKNQIIINNSSISRSKPITEVPSNLKVKVAVFPMCPVAWGQWEPYNCMLPKANCDRYGPGWSEYTNYPVGYGAIVVAHILASLEPTMRPASLQINWSYLTENKEIKAPDYFNSGDPLAKREMVGRLFKNIYDYTKSSVVKDSKGIVTGTTCLMSDVENYLASYFNYSKKTSWNINTVKNSLKATKPVLIYGKPDNICTTVLDLKEQINQAENSLALLLAETPHKIQRGKLGNQQLPENFSVGVPLQMLANRPDVRSAEFSLAQAFYTTNAARAAFYPSITLSGSAGWTNSAGSMIVNPGKFLASAVASLTQPLFNKGANIAQLKIAKAQQEEARLSFEQTLLNAGVEVNEALVQYQTAREKADYYNKQVASLQTAAKSTSLLMKHGNTTYLEVLTAQQTLLNAQLSQVANRFTEIQGVITLYQALGGGRM